MEQGNQVLVVVSAMGKETDNLIALANAVSATQPGRELDMLLTVGERKSMALLCMALADRGVPAMSSPRTCATISAARPSASTAT